MPNNKTNSGTSTIEGKWRVCLIRTLTDPDLHDRLKKQENNSSRYLSQSFSSIFFVNTPASLDEEVFLVSKQVHRLQEREEQLSIPRTPCPTPNSSNTSIPRFYISSSSSSEVVDNGDIPTRRYTF